MSDQDSISGGDHLAKFLFAGGIAMVVMAFFVLGSRHTRNSPPEGMTPGASPAEAVWLTDINAARAAAKAQNRPIFLLFTGSTWCPPCQQLERSILSQREFAEYASANLVLLKTDIRQEAVGDDQKALMNEYLVRVFPTMIVERDGKEKARWLGVKFPNAQAMFAALDKLK